MSTYTKLYGSWRGEETAKLFDSIFKVRKVKEINRDDCLKTIREDGTPNI